MVDKKITFINKHGREMDVSIEITNCEMCGPPMPRHCPRCQFNMLEQAKKDRIRAKELLKML